MLDGISDEEEEEVDAYNEDGARGVRDLPVDVDPTMAHVTRQR